MLNRPNTFMSLFVFLRKTSLHYGCFSFEKSIKNLKNDIFVKKISDNLIFFLNFTALIKEWAFWY